MTITVFLADDHTIVRDGLRALIGTQPDLQVIGDTDDGRQAVYEVRRLQPDVVVLDISMPELNGIEVTRQITETRGNSSVLILSMYASGEYIYQALQAGALGYMLKTSASTEIFKAIRTVRGGTHYFCQKISGDLVADYLLARTKLETSSPITQLSPREREIIQMVAEGKSSAAIGAMLALSTKTVETYRSRLMRKLYLSDITDLIKFAIQHGLISLD